LPRRRGGRGSELGHLEADLGDDHLGGVGADAGDLVEAGDGRERRRSLPARSPACGGDVIDGGCLRRGDPGDQLVDPEGERLDLRAQGVDLIEQHLGELCVVGVEAAGQGLHERGVLHAHAPARETREQLGVALACDQGLDHRPAGDAEDVGRHARELDQGVLEQLLQPLAWRERSSTRSRRSRV
jgi:hypothetical protein